MASTIRALCLGANFLEISFPWFFTKMYQKVPTVPFYSYFSISYGVGMFHPTFDKRIGDHYDIIKQILGIDRRGL
jgi:hypothetical protein